MFTESQKACYAYLRSVTKVNHIPDGTAVGNKKLTGNELSALKQLTDFAYNEHCMFNLHVASSVYTRKTMLIFG